MKKSQLDLVVTSTTDSKVGKIYFSIILTQSYILIIDVQSKIYVLGFTVMLEASAEILPKDTVKAAVAKGVKEAARIAKAIQEMSTKWGKPIREPHELPSCKEEIVSSMKR